MKPTSFCRNVKNYSAMLDFVRRLVGCAGDVRLLGDRVKRRGAANHMSAADQKKRTKNPAKNSGVSKLVRSCECHEIVAREAQKVGLTRGFCDFRDNSKKRCNE
jgi:hypothetical protein